jgi:hypothetical protein
MTRIDPDDPKWTAYVLDELDADERAAVELELNASEEARGIVEELRVAAAMMKTELRSAVTVESLTDQQRNTIVAAAGPIRRERRSYKPQWFWITGFSVAASAIIAIVLIVGEKQPVPLSPAVAGNSQPVVQSKSVAPAEGASTPPDKQPSAKEIPSKQPPQRNESIIQGARLSDETRDATTADAPKGAVEAEKKDAGKANGDTQKREDFRRQFEQAAEPLAVTNFAPASAPKALDEKADKIVTGAKEMVVPPPPPAAPMAPIARALPAGTGGTIGANRIAMPPPSSYLSVRGFINQNMLPPRNTVRVEDMVNYFTYDYPQPAANNVLTASIESAAAPWNEQHRLVRIGVHGIDRRVQGLMSTVPARNVSIAVAFDSAIAQDHRFIGSEEGPRPIANLNPGQSATLLYEIVPAGKSAGPITVTINYVEPTLNQTRSLVFRYVDSGNSFAGSSSDFRFAAAVASFGMILSDSPYKGTATIDGVRRIVADSIGTDSNGMRREFLQLVQRAAQIQE